MSIEPGPVNLSTGSGFVGQTWRGAWGSDGPIFVGDLNGDGTSARRRRGTSADLCTRRVTIGICTIRFCQPTLAVATSCRIACGLLRAFHDAVPEHEVVTMHLEFKGGDDGGSCDQVFPDFSDHDLTHQTPEGLDARLREQLGDALFSPGDLLRRCPKAQNLQEAVKSPCGWPTLDELRGKIIVATLASNFTGRSDTGHSEDALSLYASQANTRAAFIAPLHLTDHPPDYPGLTRNTYVVFNTEVFDPGNAHNVREKFPGMLLRSADRGNSAAFAEAQDDFNFILPDPVSYYQAPWSRTHNQYGYPFCPLGVHGNICWAGRHALSDKHERAHTLAIDVRSSDVDHMHDDFAFARSMFGPEVVSWTAFVLDASDDNVHHWAKGCLMARREGTPESP